MEAEIIRYLAPSSEKRISCFENWEVFFVISDIYAAACVIARLQRLTLLILSYSFLFLECEAFVDSVARLTCLCSHVTKLLITCWVPFLLIHDCSPLIGFAISGHKAM